MGSTAKRNRKGLDAVFTEGESVVVSFAKRLATCICFAIAEYQNYNTYRLSHYDNMIFTRKTAFGLSAATALAPTNFGEIRPILFGFPADVVTLNTCTPSIQTSWSFFHAVTVAVASLGRSSWLHCNLPDPSILGVVIAIDLALTPITDGASIMTFVGSDNAGETASVPVIFVASGCVCPPGAGCQSDGTR